MSRPFLALTFLFVLTTLVAAKDDAPLGPPGATLEQVQNHPDDEKLLSKFVSPHFREISVLVDESPDAAEKKLKELEATLDSLKPAGEKATALLDRIKDNLKFYRDDIALARVTLADVEKALTEKPDDADALRNWRSKALGEIGGIAYSRPDEAEAKLTAAKEFSAKIAEAAQEETTKKAIVALSDPRRGSFTQLEKAIATGRELAGLIGKDAAPLTVETWVNGTPLTAADLHGKVVLLDFWAVWCGPCIMTFPHLREWQEKYGDKGLVIVGLTNYYKWSWDDDAGYAASDKEASPEQEQEMLQKFAAYYHLKHRFAVQKEDDQALPEYYGVSGIPHVVVIDQQGKVRMIRVGSGKQNAQDLDKLLTELLK